jgi:hypothetical protein
MSIFPAGYLNSHKDDADDAIDIIVFPQIRKQGCFYNEKNVAYLFITS